MGRTYRRCNQDLDIGPIDGYTERKLLQPIYDQLVKNGHIIERPNPNTQCVDPDPYIEINLKLKFE